MASLENVENGFRIKSSDDSYIQVINNNVALTNQNGTNEGGQIIIQPPNGTDSTVYPCVIDNYANSCRIFLENPGGGAYNSCIFEIKHDTHQVLWCGKNIVS